MVFVGLDDIVRLLIAYRNILLKENPACTVSGMGGKGIVRRGRHFVLNIPKTHEAVRRPIGYGEF